MKRRMMTIVTWWVLAVTGIPLFSGQAPAITIKEEEELAGEFLKMALPRIRLIRDPMITTYVESVGNRILSHMPQQPFKYHFYVIRGDEYNAFAAPAGHVFIYSGLIEAMESEGELAGILGHEIAHVALRHISQKVEQSSRIGLATLAGMAVGILLGAGGAGEAASAVTMGSLAAGQSLSLAYSREDERQADEIGMDYLTSAGYEGEALLKILGKIRNKEWYGSDVVPTYLKTHPAIGERMVYIQNWIQDHPAGSPPSDTDDRKFLFDRAHTRLSAAYGKESIAKKRFESRVRKHPDDAMGHYGYGLVLSRSGHRKQAVGHMKTALEKNAFDPWILRDLGQIYYMDGSYEQAEKALKGAVSIGPDDPNAQFYLGRTHLALKQYEEAASTFGKLIEKHPKFKDAYYFIGEAHGKLEQLDLAHYYLGRYYHQNRELENSVFHLNRSLKLMKDPEKRDEINQLLEKLRKMAARVRQENAKRPVSR